MVLQWTYILQSVHVSEQRNQHVLLSTLSARVEPKRCLGSGFYCSLCVLPRWLKMPRALIDNPNWLLRAESKRLWLPHKASMSKSGKNAVDKEIIISLLRHTWEPLVQAVSFLEHWTARAACWCKRQFLFHFASVTESAHVGGFLAKFQGWQAED